MNHSFVLSLGEIGPDGPVCGKCRRKELDHTEHAICEACPNVGPCVMYPDVNGMLLCQSCVDKEELIRNSPEMQEKRVKDLKEASRIDTLVQIRSDVFNAETVSIVEIKSIIDEDVEITNKHFRLAEVITERLNGFKKAIFEKNEELVELANRQQAIQVYLNELSNKLRVEEREKIKLADINYKPNPVKISKPRESKVRKFDKTEVNKYAILANVPASVLQTVCLAKNMSPEQACDHLKAMMAGITK